MLLRSIILDNNILKINYSILQTTISTFINKFSTDSCLNRYDKMKPLVFQNRTWAILRRKMVNVWIGFYMIYRLRVIYSDKVWISMFISVTCHLWCDSKSFFRLLRAFPVKIFKFAMSFYSSLVYMCPIFCRCFLFLMISNIL